LRAEGRLSRSEHLGNRVVVLNSYWKPASLLDQQRVFRWIDVCVRNRMNRALIQ